MQTWPAEIFDRLPLFFFTLSSYRPDLEVSFIAVGDAGCDQWPLGHRISPGASIWKSASRRWSVKAAAATSRELWSAGLAYYLRHHVAGPAGRATVSDHLGDATMHKRVPGKQIKALLNDGLGPGR